MPVVPVNDLLLRLQASHPGGVFGQGRPPEPSTVRVGCGLDGDNQTVARTLEVTDGEVARQQHLNAGREGGPPAPNIALAICRRVGQSHATWRGALVIVHGT